jgi:pantetheine-phosphate adenylyltransferase
MKKAVFAGTFDPITIGHEKVIEIASKTFDKLYVSLGVNPEKHPIFSTDLRLEMIKKVCEKYDNVEVVYHEGMLVDLMKEKGITYTVRGVRNDSDYIYENEMHLFNKSLYPEIITLFIPCDKEYASISSTAVRNAVKNGEDLKPYLSKEVIEIIKENK